MNVVISDLKNFKVKHVDFINVVCRRINPVLDWRVWEERIMNASYSSNQGKNGKQILQLLKTGADDQNKIPDGDIDLSLEGFHSISSTIASTFLGAFKIRLNTYHMDKNIKLGLEGEARFAGTLIHELTHRAYYFTHRYIMTRKTSVPYLTGTITTKSYIDYYSDERRFLSSLLGDYETLLPSRVKFVVAG